MEIRFLYPVKGVDPKAIFPLSYLIHSFLQNHNNVGAIVIGGKDITFSRAFFFTAGRIDYEPYGLKCRDGIVYFEGSAKFNYPKNDDLFTFLVNAILKLKPGYMIKK